MSGMISTTIFIRPDIWYPAHPARNTRSDPNPNFNFTLLKILHLEKYDQAGQQDALDVHDVNDLELGGDR